MKAADKSHYCTTHILRWRFYSRSCLSANLHSSFILFDSVHWGTAKNKVVCTKITLWIHCPQPVIWEYCMRIHCKNLFFLKILIWMWSISSGLRCPLWGFILLEITTLAPVCICCPDRRGGHKNYSPELPSPWSKCCRTKSVPRAESFQNVSAWESHIALTVSPARKLDISSGSVTNNIISLGCLATIAVELHYS